MDIGGRKKMKPRILFMLFILCSVAWGQDTTFGVVYSVWRMKKPAMYSPTKPVITIIDVTIDTVNNLIKITKESEEVYLIPSFPKRWIETWGIECDTIKFFISEHGLIELEMMQKMAKRNNEGYLGRIISIISSNYGLKLLSKEYLEWIPEVPAIPGHWELAKKDTM